MRGSSSDSHYQGSCSQCGNGGHTLSAGACFLAPHESGPRGSGATRDPIHRLPLCGPSVRGQMQLVACGKPEQRPAYAAAVVAQLLLPACQAEAVAERLLLPRPSSGSDDGAALTPPGQYAALQVASRHPQAAVARIQANYNQLSGAGAGQGGELRRRGRAAPAGLRFTQGPRPVPRAAAAFAG